MMDRTTFIDTQSSVYMIRGIMQKVAVLLILMITNISHFTALSAAPKTKQKTSKTTAKKSTVDPLKELRKNISKALFAKSNSELRKTTLRDIDRYLSKQGEIPKNIQIELLEKSAKINTLEKNYKKASGIYLDLALNIVPEKKIPYLRSALIPQSELAEWPLTPPWSKLPARKHDNERRELLQTHLQLSEVLNDPSSNIASAGLIQINLGLVEDAFSFWQTKLEQNKLGRQSSYVVGFLLTAYQRASNWGEVEKLSKWSKQKKINPIYQNKTLSLSSLLADSLYFQSKAAVEASDYNSALVKLKEFDSNFGSDKRHRLVLSWLAKAYMALKKPTESLDTYTRFAQKYGMHPESANILKEAFNQAESMAAEEQAIYYGRQLQKNAAINKRIYSDETMRLAELYLATGTIEEAIATYSKVAFEKSTPNTTRENALSRLVLLESRFSSPERANAKLSDILRKQPSLELQGQIWSERVRVWEKQKDFKSLIASESTLSKLASTHPSLGAAYSQLLLALARERANASSKEYFNLNVRDPLKLLEEKYRNFIKATNYFDRVCDASEIPFCAPAQFELARMSEKMLAHLEDLSIPQSLDEAVVTRFDKRKKEVIDQMISKVEAADAKALQQVRAGKTIPDWSLEILWEGDDDYPFDRISGETTNAYLQTYPMRRN